MVDGLVAGRDDNYLKEQPDDPEPLIRSMYWRCEGLTSSEQGKCDEETL
jgi:hypothetical protein